MSDAQVEQMVWDHFERRVLTIGKSAEAAATAEIVLEARTAHGEVVSGTGRTNATMVRKLLTEAGLSMTPVLSGVLAGAKLGTEAYKLIGLLKDKKEVGLFSSADAQAATYLHLGLDGMKKMFRHQAYYSGVKVGTYSYDVATSVVDFTGLSRLPSAATRGVMKLVSVCLAKRRAKKLNEALQDRDKFKLGILKDNPLMGCYLLHELDPAILMGLFDAFDLEDTGKEQRRQVIERLDAIDQAAIKVFDNDVKPMRSKAFDKIKEHAYRFETEAKRRDELNLEQTLLEAMPKSVEGWRKDHAKRVKEEEAAWKHREVAMLRHKDEQRRKQRLYLRSPPPGSSGASSAKAKQRGQEVRWRKKLDRQKATVGQAAKAHSDATRSIASDRHSEMKKTHEKLLEEQKKYEEMRAKYRNIKKSNRL